MPKHNIQLGLVSLEELAFAYLPPAEPGDLSKLINELGFDLTYDRSMAQFTVGMRIKFVLKATGEALTPTTIGEYAAAAVYHLTDAEQVLPLQDQHGWRQLPIPIAVTLIGTTYSTLRGMIFARFATTPLRNVPLPLLDPLTVLNSIPKGDTDPK